MSSQYVTSTIIEEGPRNAVVKIVGYLDTSDVNEVSIIAPNQFNNNEPGWKYPTTFRVDAIIWSVGSVEAIELYWNADTDVPIATLSKSSKLDVTGDGGLLPPLGANTPAGFDGSINLVSSGYIPGGAPQVFTVLLRLVKLYVYPYGAPQ